MRKCMVSVFVVLLVAAAMSTATAQEVDWSSVQQIFNRTGTIENNVLILDFPRADLNISVGEFPLKPQAGASTRFAFQQITPTEALVTAEFVLLQEEVGPVTAVLDLANLDIAAIHNHLLFEEPRLIYLHVSAVGDATVIASALKAALSVTGTPLREIPDRPVRVDWTDVSVILGFNNGHAQDATIEFDIPINFAVTLGANPLTPEAGAEHELFFQRVVRGLTIADGEFGLTAAQVKPVIRILKTGGFEVSAIHNHFLTESPRLFFLHYLRVGKANRIAETLRAVLDELGIQGNLDENGGIITAPPAP